MHVQFSQSRKSVQKTCEVNAAVENSSFIFTAYVKSVPLYHFKLAYVVIHMAVWLSKNFLIPIFKNVEMVHFHRSQLIVILADLEISLIPSHMKVHAEFSFTPNIYCLI